MTTFFHGEEGKQEVNKHFTACINHILTELLSEEFQFCFPNLFSNQGLNIIILQCPSCFIFMSFGHSVGFLWVEKSKLCPLLCKYWCSSSIRCYIAHTLVITLSFYICHYTQRYFDTCINWNMQHPNKNKNESWIYMLHFKISSYPKIITTHEILLEINIKYQSFCAQR